MGHRQFHNTSSLFEGEPDQNWNHMHTDQQCVHLGRTSTSENGSFIYPAENMSIDNMSFPSHWNSSTRSNGYASSSNNIDVPPHQSDASGTYNDHFVDLSSAGPSLFIPLENYAHQPSSSNYDRQTFHVDGGFIDLTMGSGQGHHKRKSPGIPSVYEGGSTSRYFNAGSSTDLPISSELWQEKPNIDCQYIPWDHYCTMTPTLRGTGLSIKGEGSLRNVRSRSTLDLDSNLARTHSSSNHSHNSYPTVPPVDHSSTVDLSGQTSVTLTRDWSQMNISPANGRVLLSDTGAFGLETSHFLVGSGATASNAASVDVGGFHHEFGTSRNPTAPQSFHNTQTQTARGIRSNYSQRSTPTFRASSSLRLGQVTSDDGLPMVAESYSSRLPRPLSTIGRRNDDRNGRSRISSERYRSLAESGLHDRFSSEGFMVVERASVYGSRNMLDQHRDMRMDVDNMSYEELLALGERIGYVNTGISEDSLNKCLTETIYCSSEQSQDEGNCVICLEEYKNMDDVGTLKTCGHDYHVSCIKKWLSLRKLCPICKVSALPEDTKDK
ncbi:E3 ubiquitin-protein ligase MBR2 [Glycine max]|nr:E3 ubiquitin-protein ligase MBR2 [Glycine max]KAH1258607.1 E3 ubiquitin-protein ligase MBR2 [Glycine max]KAH1258608.1 E3 ubiquitin-protein ligase MBR2 [Glycine max]KAH1258609.1 E3 ubiquitin-protein ligase MBR2 [Glycine max]KAH1258610.1 E3 ubiquitin-protein ligase MBR2 [Glycine max]